MTNTNEIVLHHLNDVLHVRINRPEKKNALTGNMYDEMRCALESAIEDNAIRAVLIYGSEFSFTAGNDLSDFDKGHIDGESPAAKLLNTLHLFDKPIVAAVSGLAVGIGATILLHCDLVYASPTRFRMPFINLGVCPEAGATLLLPMFAGHRKAAEILMLGEFFDTSTAIDIGLVTAEVEKNELLDMSIKKAEHLAKKPLNALKATKNLMKKSQRSLLTEHMKEELCHFSELLNSPESKLIRTTLLTK